MPATGPNRCAMCDYDLRGLPVPHRCPECGLEYDEHTRIWRTSRPQVFYILLIVIAAQVVGPLVRIVVMLRTGRPIWKWDPILLALILATVLVLALLAWRVRLPRWLAITPRGLVIRYVLGPELIPWDNLTDVAPSFGRRYITIGRRSRGLFREQVKGILKPGDEVTEFVQAVQAAQERAARTQVNRTEV